MHLCSCCDSPRIAYQLRRLITLCSALLGAEGCQRDVLLQVAAGRVLSLLLLGADKWKGVPAGGLGV